MQDKDTSTVELPEKLIPDEARTSLAGLLGPLVNSVELGLYSEKGAVDVYTRFARQIAGELASCSTKIVVREYKNDEYKDLPGPKKLPLLTIKAVNASKPILYMHGAPIGEEGRALVQGIVIAGTGDHKLSATAAAAAAELKSPRELLVFGAAGCPYCPGQMLLAAGLAQAAPEYVTAYAVAADQFQDLAQKYKVGGVPHTVVNDTYNLVGLLPDDAFSKFLVNFNPEDLGGNKGALLGQDTQSGAAAPADQARPHVESSFSDEVVSLSSTSKTADEFNVDLIILGGGPAGLAAAIYAGRAGLSATVLDTGVLGGQVNLTPVIENYPGFKKIAGSKLVDHFREQAEEYAHLRGNTAITNLESKDGLFVVHTANGLYRGRSIIIATGGSSSQLGIPGEAAFSGRGVHYCASCDGYMYVGKKVFIVGGGNTALTDALHLKNLGMDVTIVHRRDAFRGEKALADSVTRQGIRVLWDSAVIRITGENKVQELILKNLKTGAENTEKTDAVFVSIGYAPNSRPGMALKTELNPDRSIKVDMHMRTSVPRVYSAGDVTGWGRQVVSAVAAGSIAAMSAFEDLQKS